MVLELNRRDERLLAVGSAGPATSPFQLRKILVPVDFSDCAKKALQYALPLAKQHGAAITLLFVVAPPAYYAYGYPPAWGPYWWYDPFWPHYTYFHAPYGYVYPGRVVRPYVYPRPRVYPYRPYGFRRWR